MISVQPFCAADLAAMTIQPEQACFAGDRSAVARSAAAAGRCFTIRAPNGEVLFCGGAIEAHADYASLWAVLSARSGPWLAAITRRTRWFIAGLPHARIDASARIDFAQANRWLRMLGFEREAVLGGYLPGGADAAIYRWKGE